MYELQLTSSLSGSQDLSRSNSGARANDRLQERLNRAIAKRNSEGRKDVSSSAVSTSSGAATPPINPDIELPERTNDPEHVEQPSKGHDTSTIGRDTPTGSGLPKDGDSFADGSLLHLHDASASSLSQPTSGLSTPATASGRTSFENPILFSPDSVSANTPEVTNDQPSHTQISGSKVSDVDLNVLRFKIEHEALEKRLQEELLPYIEKIDALQSKLQYLSQEAVESAQQAAAGAPAGSTEQKKAEKDKKIALLMEEGQTLSKNEMKHLAIIKTLRSQAASAAREQSVLKGRTDAAERGLAAMEQRAIRAERKLQSFSVEDRE